MANDQAFLRERTVVLAGPFSSTIQGLIKKFTFFGADCLHLGEDISISRKFTQLVSDERERNEKFGRAGAIQCSFENVNSIREGLGSCVQTFGGIDVVVDAIFNDASQDVENLLRQNFLKSMWLSESVLPFLKNRKKARMIFLMNAVDFDGDPALPWKAASRAGLVALAKGLSQQLLLENIPVNVVTLALTEEFLLSLHPDLSIKESLEKMRLKNPLQKITEPDRTGELLSFLISTQGAGLTGQVFHAK